MIDFPLILLCLVVFTGTVCLGYRILSGGSKEAPKIVEQARSLFPVLCLVFLIRSFIAQPYQVPSGSLKPTVLPGDFILVNQYIYGLKFPVWNTRLIPFASPKRGEVVLFHWPVHPKITFVKRVVGIPGDMLSYHNKTLRINGKKISRKMVKCTKTLEGSVLQNMCQYQENLLGKVHPIAICAAGNRNCPTVSRDFYALKIPKGHYFVMGDNRDNSDDSRDWGFVSEKDLIGRAFFIWMSWNPEKAPWNQKIRWHRVFSWIR